MLGLSGIGWMFISLTFSYVTHEIMRAIEVAAGENFVHNNHKGLAIIFEISCIAMLVYMAIGIFLGPKWYITPLFFLGSFIVSGKILHWVTTLMVKKATTLINVVFPLFTILQLIAGVLAYITWF